MRGTVVNTPGYYYAISYWLSALVMILVHGCGKKDVWKYVYGVLSFISIFTVMFFTDGKNFQADSPNIEYELLHGDYSDQDGRRASMA